MKKIFLLLVGVIFLSTICLGLHTNVYATDTDDMIVKHALTGRELTEFEQNEQAQQSLRSFTTDEATLQMDYQSLKNSGILGEDVTFEMYVDLATTAPPTDPVSPEFRNQAVRGVSDLKPGDFLITNATSFDGYTGHAGIYTGNGFIMSIQKPGTHPAQMHVMQWMYNYNKPGKWTKVYRPAPRYKGPNAGEWAINHYNGTNYSYGITTNIFGLNPTYCSKIVWQSYWYASGAVQVGGMYQPVIAKPYDMPKYFDTPPTHTQTWKG